MRKLLQGLLIIFILTLTLVSITWGRAGGAGGGSGGRSSGGSSRSFGGGGYHSSGSGYMGHSTYGGSGNYGNSTGSLFMFLIIIIILIYFLLKFKPGAQSLSSADNSDSLDSLGAIKDAVRPAGMTDDEINLFYKKVNLAFLTIQESWSKQNVSLMRRFISDGVYQRFHAQFSMMKWLNQTDIMKNVDVKDLAIVSYREEGLYEILDVQIYAYAEDQFISQKFPVLNSPGGGEEFIEYWSFIRKKLHKVGADIYQTEVCPQCSAALDAKLVETARCSYCGTYLNNGEFDWVLSEITQEADYTEDSAQFNARYATTLQNLTRSIPDFSKQLIEDRASNAFMQIIIATATKQNTAIARFSSANGLTQFETLMNETDYIYDRLFLNSVDLTSLRINNNQCTITAELYYSYRRVKLNQQFVELLDDDIIKDKKKTDPCS